MSVIATIWNFIINQVNNFKFVITQQNKWKFVIKQFGFKFNIEQENDWNFKIQKLTPNDVWILRDGTWNDDLFWIDTALWKDS